MFNPMQGHPILVIDDEPEMRAALSHSLTRSGYAVEIASSGIEALEKFKDDKFGVVITDIKMPEMSGMQVLEKIKKISPQMPVIMITAYGTIDNAVKAMKQGASDYIIKPFSAEILEETVRKVYGKSENRETDQAQYSTSKKACQKNEIITNDPEMLGLLKLAGNVAPSNSTVLILGESGTGKEMLASYIHRASGRSMHPYVALNCAALPENLVESELFGYEKGAFTGAAGRKLGKLELANQGTIVLDEISEMALPFQAKLLRALQEREIDRIGGSKPVPIDVRIIAISNIDLKKAVKEGKFREDLFYRVNVIPFTVPPLRERKTDIPLLANHFLKKYCLLNKRETPTLTEESFILLSKCEWKGNIRELENVIERAVIMSDDGFLKPKHLFLEDSLERKGTDIPFRAGLSVKEMEKALIFQTLGEVNNNRTHAARLLGISIRTLRNKLRDYRVAP